MVTSSEKLCKFKRKTVLSGEQLTWKKTPLKKKIRSRLAFEKHVTRKVLQKFFYSSSKSETKVTIKWIFQDRGFRAKKRKRHFTQESLPPFPLFSATQKWPFQQLKRDKNIGKVWKEDGKNRICLLKETQ